MVNGVGAMAVRILFGPGTEYPTGSREAPHCLQRHSAVSQALGHV